MQIQEKWRHLFKKTCYFRPISRRQGNTSSSNDKSYLCELLWTVSPWLLSVHSKRYSRPYIHIISFPTRTIMVWNLMIDSWADWCLCWLAGGVITQLFSPETLQWILWLQMTSTAKGCRACTSTGPGGFTLVQVATSYPSLCCVNRIISAEISPPLHWTAHHCPSTKIRWERIHIPHNLEETEDGWKDGGLEGWTSRISHQKSQDNNCEFRNRDILNWLLGNFADDKNETNLQSTNTIACIRRAPPGILGFCAKMNLPK